MYSLQKKNKSPAFGRALRIILVSADIKQRSTALFHIIADDNDKFNK